jgi:hypothetical protein
MTLVQTRGTEAASTEVSWSSPDLNLWVATVNGDYAGMIEFTDGHFVVNDHTGEIVATTSSIPAAQSELTAHAEARVAANPVTELISHLAPRLSRAPRTSYARGNAKCA